MVIHLVEKAEFFPLFRSIWCAGEKVDGELKAGEYDSVANYERKRNLYFLLYCAKVEGEQRHISLALIACGTAVAHDTGAMSLGTSVRPDPSHWRGSAPGGRQGPAAPVRSKESICCCLGAG